tara:strand:- start:306 stop:1016 length:711 start_codon:yes stop_codon:yes gene_type:complete
MKIRKYNLGYYYVPKKVNGICVDIGANVGSFIHKNAHKFSIFHYYEAYEPNFQACQRIASDMDNVIGFNEAVSDKDNQIVELLIPKSEDCGSIAIDSSHIEESSCWNGKLSENIKTVSLNTILKRTNGYIDYMKVDCETSEYPLLINKNLSNIGIIVIEIHCQLGKRRAEELVNYIKKTHRLIKEYSTSIGFKAEQNELLYFQNKKINNEKISLVHYLLDRLYYKLYENYMKYIRA